MEVISVARTTSARAIEVTIKGSVATVVDRRAMVVIVIMVVKVNKYSEAMAMGVLRPMVAVMVTVEAMVADSWATVVMAKASPDTLRDKETSVHHMEEIVGMVVTVGRPLVRIKA